MPASTLEPRASVPQPLAPRASCLETESAFAVSARVRQLRAEGRDILDLSIGEPDLPTPDCIVESGTRALSNGVTRYTPPAGLADLRSAVAEYQNSTAEPSSRRAAEDVFVTPGAKPALLYALLAIVGPGDEVLVPDPGFAPYTSQVHLAGAIPVAYAADSLDEHVTSRTRAIIINSPANPTGATLGPAQLIAIADLAERHDLWIISDEIYSRIWFGEGKRAPSIVQLPGMAQRTIVVDGFSKAWRMTGWRLGYAVVPEEIGGTFERIIVNAHSCVPGFVQHAGVAALSAGERLVSDYVNQLRTRRDTLVTALNKLPGVTCGEPDGAFYAFPDCSELLKSIGEDGRRGRCRRTVPLVRRQRPRWPSEANDAAPSWPSEAGADDITLQKELLEKLGVATIAGSTFGAEGAGHLRFSFAAPAISVSSAITRLTQKSHASTPSHSPTPTLS